MKLDFSKYFSCLPSIETERLLLRQITSSKSDGRDSLEFINDYSVYRYWDFLMRIERVTLTKDLKTDLLDYHYKETIKEYEAGNELAWVMESRKIKGYRRICSI